MGRKDLYHEVQQKTLPKLTTRIFIMKSNMKTLPQGGDNDLHHGVYIKNIASRGMKIFIVNFSIKTLPQRAERIFIMQSSIQTFP